MNCHTCGLETKNKVKNVPLCRSCKERLPEAKALLIKDIQEREEKNMLEGGFQLAPPNPSTKLSIMRLKILISDEKQEKK